MVTLLALYVAAAGFAVAVYTYVGYPALLWIASRVTRTPLPASEPAEWPTVSITVPAYNEERQVRDLVESLLALDYPRDKVQILVVSDASSDRTDEIVREYADRGVELLRMPARGGKTKAENAAAERLTGEIVVNTDASIRIAPHSLKRLVSAFQNPDIGLASGRDVSVSPGDSQGNLSETGYVGYEMAIRDLETRTGGIIGASGCFYAIRPELHRLPLPESLSRDFAAALHTHEHGFRAVSVPDATCFVPRTESLRQEYRRKVRTIMRGMETLWHMRALLNPLRHGVFAFKIFSHKILRWLLPWVGGMVWIALGVLSFSSPVALTAFVVVTVVVIVAIIGWLLNLAGPTGPILGLPAFVLAGNVAAAYAFLRAVHGDKNPTWEPTRR